MGVPSGNVSKSTVTALQAAAVGEGVAGMRFSVGLAVAITPPVGTGAGSVPRIGLGVSGSESPAEGDDVGLVWVLAWVEWWDFRSVHEW